MIPNPDNDQEEILEPLSKMTTGNKSQYIANVKVMNYLLQAIPNDIYNSLDACKNAKEMWERIKRLMFGSKVTSHVRHSRLMDKFDKFAPKEGESLESVYERLTTLVNIMDLNNVRPIPVSINTKFLKCLQPEWSKYVIMRSQTDGHKDANDNLDINVSHMQNVPDGFLGPDRVLSTSYAGAAGASAKDQPKVNSNFRTLVADPIFDGVNIYIPRKVVEKAGLEVVLEGGPWLIHKYLIILNKWSMDTRLLKEELTRIPIWVKLHDVPIQVFKEDGISLIATFIGKPADLVDVVTIGIPSLYGDGFTKENIHVEYEWRPPRICKIFGHVHDHFPNKVKKRKGKSRSTYGGQFAGPLIKQNVRYEQKATASAPKKGVTNVGNTYQSASMLKTTSNSSKKDNLSISNSFSILNDDEEDVENVYDESANLIHNTKASGSSSFTATVG
ncbi:zinc knuckle CX2CX4HX4C containing protein [Tanacetum coccineum]